MQQTPYEKVPLTQDDKEMLLSIYQTRLRFWFCVYIVLFAFAFAYSRKIDFTGRYSNRISYWEENEDAKYISRFQMRMINLSILELPVVATGLYFLFKNVLPFKRDVVSGVKEKVPYLIIRKQFFPLTNQYFVGFNDPGYMHHEIDEKTYNLVKEGDNMFVYRAKLSKYVFKVNGRFTIL